MASSPAYPEFFDLASFGGTDLAMETGVADGTERWFRCAVAGLQYSDYDKDDELIGRIRPSAGDRLTMVRRPENAYDANAIEVHWRNNHFIGHMPREIAAAIAGLMDDGHLCRCYVADPGDGRAWSMKVIVVGNAAEPLHARRVRIGRKIAESELQQPPTDKQWDAALHFERSEQRQSIKR